MNTKTKSYLLLLTTLIIGFGAGFLTNGFLVNRKLDRMHQMMSQQDRFTERVLSAGELTAEEKALAEPILIEHFHKIRGLHQAHRQELRSAFQNLKGELSAVLPNDKVQQMGKALRLRLPRKGKSSRGGKDKPHNGPPPMPEGKQK